MPWRINAPPTLKLPQRPAIPCASPSSTTGSTPGAAPSWHWPSCCGYFPTPTYSRWWISWRLTDRARLGSRTIRTSFIQRLPFARTAFRRYLPLFPRAIESIDVSAYDLVVSSSHAVAKGVRTTATQLHICYCYTPMRYAWDLRDQYLRQVGLDRGVNGRVVRRSLARLREWDRVASGRVDHFVTISARHRGAHPPLL